MSDSFLENAIGFVGKQPARDDRPARPFLASRASEIRARWLDDILGPEAARDRERREFEAQARIEAAKEMLRGSHQAIFGAQGERLARTDAFDDRALGAAETSRRQARRAWRLAKDHVRDRYDLRTCARALRELGLE